MVMWPAAAGQQIFGVNNLFSGECVQAVQRGGATVSTFHIWLAVEKPAHQVSWGHPPGPPGTVLPPR